MKRRASHGFSAKNQAKQQFWSAPARQRFPNAADEIASSQVHSSPASESGVNLPHSKSVTTAQ
jgi:hypothetical protein